MTVHDNARNRTAPYVINARFLEHRITGVQRYAREISARLTGSPALLAPGQGKGLRGHLWEQTALPRLAGGRLLWSPCAAGPFSYRRQVVTFHDLFPIEHPEWYGKGYALWYSFLFRRLARTAVHLLAVSEYTKGRLVELLGVDSERITVAPNGVSPALKPTTGLEAARAGAALALPSRRYVLSVSSLESRKNLRTLLAAWREALPALPDTVWLVLAGPRPDAQVFGRQELGPAPPRVHFAGYVPDEHLAALYWCASLFVFPSLAEGFGLPLLEAMSCGLRAVSSDRASLPEVGGGAVVYVDPLDRGAMARAIVQTLRKDSAASAPWAPGLEQAAKFNWDRSARIVEAVLLQEAEASHAPAVKRSGPSWRLA